MSNRNASGDPPAPSKADDGPAGSRAGNLRHLPSFSFVLLVIAIVAAGTGAATWALVRPEPRSVEILIPTPGPLVVHVTGAVQSPGIYTLPPGSRVSDVIEAAGGLSEASGINLAAELRDGQQIVVPGAAIAASETRQPGSLAGPPPGATVLLDLNTASPQQLEALPNIGPTRAASIVDFRERNGPILFVDDLAAIDGIGPATVDGLRSLVVQP